MIEAYARTRINILYPQLVVVSNYDSHIQPPSRNQQSATTILSIYTGTIPSHTPTHRKVTGLKLEARVFKLVGFSDLQVISSRARYL